MQEHQDYGHASRAAPVAGAMMPSAGRCGEREEQGCCQERNGQQEPRAEAKSASQVALLLGAGGK